MLTRTATQVTTREALNAVGGNPDDGGTTSPPSGFVAPTFNIVCSQKPYYGWTASVQILHNADEGTNAAYYLGPGLYSTDLMFNGGLTNYIAGPGNRRIYVEISQSISTDARDAELEHCNDIVHSFNITLGAVQNALNAARVNNPYGPFDKRDKAMRAGRDAICNGLHARLATLVRNAVNVSGQVDHYGFARELGRLYRTICDMSQDRDNVGWHTLAPDRTAGSWSARSWVEYLSSSTLPSSAHGAILGEVKDVRALVRGPAFQVNVTPSAQVCFL